MWTTKAKSVVDIFVVIFEKNTEQKNNNKTRALLREFCRLDLSTGQYTPLCFVPQHCFNACGLSPDNEIFCRETRQATEMSLESRDIWIVIISKLRLFKEVRMFFYFFNPWILQAESLCHKLSTTGAAHVSPAFKHADFMVTERKWCIGRFISVNLKKTTISNFLNLNVAWYILILEIPVRLDMCIFQQGAWVVYDHWVDPHFWYPSCQPSI